MSDSESAAAKLRPLHLWVVGVVALLWNAFGAMDYIMTQTRNEAYMSSFSEEQLAYFYGFPNWIVAAWAIAVWGGMLGAILLLLRKKLAAWVYLVSLVAFVLTTFYNYVLSNGLQVAGDTFSLVFTAVIFIVSLALMLYAFALSKRRVLV